MKRIAIFASGSGSNAEKIMEYFRGSEKIRVELIVCDKPGAGVLKRAKKYEVDTLMIQGKDLREPETLIQSLQSRQIDLLVLAGFLRMIPSRLVEEFPDKIINLHPSLLPKYGGKGMYGHFVHEAVLANGETESGITIHYVNKKYDDGAVIFQASCPVEEGDSPDTLYGRIQKLEHFHFPRIVEKVVSQ